jgi:PEGA domain-containing protein
MIFSKTIVALAAGSLLASVSPVLAQHRSGGGNRGAARDGQAARSGGSARGSSGPARSSSARPYSGSPRSYSSGSRSYVYGSSRGGYSSGARIYGGGSRGAVVIRGGGRSIGSRVIVSSGRYYRPYYTFRPRVSLGFGLWLGYPVAYPYYYDDPYYAPYGYPDPYAYPAPYPPVGYPAYPSTYPQYPPAYPSQYPSQYPSNYPPQYPSNYPPQYPSNSPSQYPSNYPPQSSSRTPQYPRASGSVGVQPGQRSTNMGGVSFEITPDTAEVFVDGSYVGAAREFTPSTRPLDLTTGHHRIEIRASGYRTITLDENIVAGQVLPFQGSMEQ